jgi:hypothetical protein
MMMMLLLVLFDHSMPVGRIRGIKIVMNEVLFNQQLLTHT